MKKLSQIGEKRVIKKLSKFLDTSDDARAMHTLKLKG